MKKIIKVKYACEDCGHEHDSEDKELTCIECGKKICISCKTERKFEPWCRECIEKNPVDRTQFKEFDLFRPLTQYEMEHFDEFMRL